MKIEFPSNSNISPDAYLRFLPKETSKQNPNVDSKSSKTVAVEINEVLIHHPPSDFTRESSKDLEKIQGDSENENFARTSTDHNTAIPFQELGVGPEGERRVEEGDADSDLKKNSIRISDVSISPDTIEIAAEESENNELVQSQSKDTDDLEGERVESDEELYEYLPDEEENVDLEEENVDLEEENVDLEEGDIESEEETASVEESSSNQENEVANQLVVEEDQSSAKSRFNLEEGEYKFDAGSNSATMVESDLNLAGIEETTANENLNNLKNTMVQNETESEKAQKSREQVVGNIKNEKVALNIKQNTVNTKQNVVNSKSKELDELYSKSHISPELIDRAIDNKLKNKAFDGIYNKNGISLREDKEAKAEGKRKINAYLQAHPEENPSQAIENAVKEWINDLDLQKLDSKGTLVRLTFEEKQQLVDVLVAEVANYIVDQHDEIKNKTKQNNTDHALHDHVYITNNNNKWKPRQVNGKENQEFLHTMVRSTQCMLDRGNELAQREIKLLEQLENIDIAYRIKEMQIFKNRIKQIKEEIEIEHSDKEHRIVLLDGQTRDDIEVIFRLKAYSRKNWSKIDIRPRN